LTKYGPTALAVIATPVAIKLKNTFGKWMNNAFRTLMNERVGQGLQYKNFEVTEQGGSKKKYNDLDEEQKQDITSKIVDGIKTLESELHSPKYLKPILSTGTKTAVETGIGYMAGRLYSQIN